MIKLSNISKIYERHGKKITAVNNINVKIEHGDFYVIHGESGSGKSTILFMIGGMLKPTTGTIEINNRNIYGISSGKRNKYRREMVGFIFQKFFLMPYLTVYDNIKLALSIKKNDNNIKEHIEQLAVRFRLQDRLDHLPSELSVGEQQRTAMIRAIAPDPEIIIADEPTGNLDPKNTDIIALALKEECQNGRTVILASHDNTIIDIGKHKMKIDS